jgi:hypothetical protein
MCIHYAASAAATHLPIPTLPAAVIWPRPGAERQLPHLYVSANAGCGYSWPTLARAPSLDTKWIFDPAPGGIFKWYIRISVSKGRPLGCIPAVPAPAAVPAAAAAAAAITAAASAV